MADIIYMAKSKWRQLLDTIRTKGGTSAAMTADQAIAAVDAIPTGGSGELQIDLSHDYMDGVEWFRGNINGTTGAFTPATTGLYWTTDYIDVSMLDRFTMIQDSASSPMQAYNASFFDSNKRHVQRSASAASSVTTNGGIVPIIPVPADAKYFRYAMVESIRDLMHIYSVAPGTARVGGEWTTDGIASGREPYGDITINSTALGTYALAYRTNLTHVSAPNLTTIPSGVFMYCAGLVSVDMPNVTTMSAASLFNACSRLVEAKFPKLASALGSSAFLACTSLETVDIGSCTSIGATAFATCRKLKTLIMRKSDGLTALTNVNGFLTSPFASGGEGGTIYIPEIVYDHLGDGTALDYKSATNWSVYNGYGTITWAKIEGSEYEL